MDLFFATIIVTKKLHYLKIMMGMMICKTATHSGQNLYNW